ncbi:hypothetical protein HDZ31DRAFT_78467, partial [Schizophyllum fasciatum]
MGAESFPVVQFELKLALFRQGYSAFNQALVPGFQENGEHEDDDNEMETIDALQAGHTPDIARRLYGLAHNAFEGTTMTTTHLNLRNSDRWQIILHLQPGGRGSPYYHALLSNRPATSDPDAQAALPTTINQLAQLFTSQMSSVTSLVQALTQQNKDLIVDVINLRAQISSRIAATTSASSTVTPALVTPPNPEALKAQADPHVAVTPDLSLAATYDPPASSFSAANVPMRRNSDASMASNSPSSVGKASLQLTNLARPLINTSLEGHRTRVPRFFPCDESLDFLDVPVYPDQFAIPPDDAVWVLRRLLRNPEAQWKSDEQIAAIATIARLDRDICIVVRTGGGKSLVAVIPTFFEDGITVIMVPFRALLRDWERRLKEMGVAYELFANSQSQLTGTKNIILVSVDVARLAGWRDALLRLQERGVLFLRIIIDEAH